MLKITDMKPRITVIGVGGAGGNAVNNMIAAGLSGAEFIVANTDAQALAVSATERRIQLGANLTEGLGAGSKPDIGEAAAEEAVEDIRAAIGGSHLVFIAAGMGGGTGTGAASVIAREAKRLNILTVAVVTKPFQFEGSRRMRVADVGVAELKQHVDTLLVIPNQNLFAVSTERTTFAEAFVMADQVLYSGIACIVDLVLKEGLINLDLADVKTVLTGMGTAMMGTGEASGEQRAMVAAEEAIVNPLLDGVTLRGAKNLLLSITGGRSLTLWEVEKAAERVSQEVDPDANIIVGATFDENLGDKVRVSIVASGMSVSRNGRAAAHAPRLPAEDDFRHRLGQAVAEAHPHDEPAPPPAVRDAWRAPNDVLIREAVPQSGPHVGGPRGYPLPTDPPSAGRYPEQGRAPAGDQPGAGAVHKLWSRQNNAGRTSDPAFAYHQQPESAIPRKGLLQRLTNAARGMRGDPGEPPSTRTLQQETREEVEMPVFFSRKRR